MSKYGLKHICNILFVAMMCMLHRTSFAQQQQVLGLSMSHDSTYYAVQKMLYCQSANTNAILCQKELYKDTGLLNRLYEKSVRVFNIKTDSARRLARSAIQNMLIMNITAAYHKVYVTICFTTALEPHARCHFAIVQLDNALRYQTFCLLSRPGVSGGLTNFTILPFHELEFLSENMVALPALGKGSQLDYVAFLLNTRARELTRSHIVENDINAGKSLGFMASEGLLMEPLIYASSIAGRRYFYKYPYPVLYKTQNDILLDPYGLRAKIDSFSASFRGQPDNGIQNYCTNLGFTIAQKNHRQIILASGSSDSCLYMAVCNKDIAHTELVSYNSHTKVTGIKILDIPLKDHYLLFRNKRLYILDMSSGKGMISYLTL